METIRRSVFETNSSSTHSICIPLAGELLIPLRVHFRFGEFGWEYDTLESLDEKASYLYTALYCLGRKSDVDSVVATLERRGIYVTREEPVYGDWGAITNGYVDHGDELEPFLNDVVFDENRLMRFLFSPLSFIITGNDNDGDSVGINVVYAHEKYYKGN